MDNGRIKNIVNTACIGEILEDYPYVENFFAALRIDIPDDNMTISKIISAVPDAYFRDYGFTRAEFVSNIINFIDEFDSKVYESVRDVNTITIVGGRNKSGVNEEVSVEITKGEVVCIVGPTGSGKSRLLEDIECLAQNDTPTERVILIDGEVPDEELRFNLENRLVAELSQNMNFVMDLTVREFLLLHAESRMVNNVKDIVEEIIRSSNELAGEKFNSETPVTQLSGGQSRALMIADTALLSESPIILIDEIENAGIDKRKALELLVSKGKIILMATHDPILALSGDKRIIIENGGIKEVIRTSDSEKGLLPFLTKLDASMNELKNIIRNGGRLDSRVMKIFL